MQKFLNAPRIRARTVRHVMTVSLDSIAPVLLAGRATCVIRVPSIPVFLNANCLLYSTEIIECASNPCQNNATCVDSFNRFDCTCADGWTDYVCSTGELLFILRLFS